MGTDGTGESLAPGAWRALKNEQPMENQHPRGEWSQPVPPAPEDIDREWEQLVAPALPQVAEQLTGRTDFDGEIMERGEKSRS